eukprot:15432564-Alexandrium_andersonii.AAC.1
MSAQLRGAGAALLRLPVCAQVVGLSRRPLEGRFAVGKTVGQAMAEGGAARAAIDGWMATCQEASPWQ